VLGLSPQDHGTIHFVLCYGSCGLLGHERITPRKPDAGTNLIGLLAMGSTTANGLWPGNHDKLGRRTLRHFLAHLPTEASGGEDKS
jgi:hypothetical protein